MARKQCGRQIQPRRAFSLLELVVVGVIVLILVSLSIPFVQRMREVTRRRNCDQNLIRLATACAAYQASHGHLPAGTLTFNAQVQRVDEAEAILNETQRVPIRSIAEGYHHNWISGILPFVDRRGLYESIDFRASVYGEANRLPREADLALLRCPAVEDLSLPNTTSYSGSTGGNAVPIDTGNDGLMFADRWVVPDEVPDGMAYTILVGEKLSPPPDDLSWMSGTRSSLRHSGSGINRTFFGLDQQSYDANDYPPDFVGSWGSLHVGGASVAMGDGSVQFIVESIDSNLLRQKACRRDAMKANELPITVESGK